MGQGGSAERRQLTVVFCDLVGSTALSSALDPEDLHHLMVAFRADCRACIEAAGGCVARFEGDGVLAYFGYPAALEDAPQRAIHAALAASEVGARLRAPGAPPLAVRVGIATGLVVVGELERAGEAQERSITGEAVNVARRLQTLAAPGAIAISETTKRLATGVFEFQSLGEVQHKGQSAPAPVWQVIGERAAISRYEGRRAFGVSQLIGRQAELGRLLDAWRETQAGRGQAIGIVGEPGIGKSRLVEAARQAIGQAPGVVWLEGGGVSIYDNTPFQVVAQFASSLTFDPFAPLLDVERGHETVAAERERLLERVTQAIWSTAARAPTVMVIEDLHWVDPSTLEVLDILVQSNDRPLLLIYTTRIDVGARWPSDRRHVLHLAPLDESDSASLARSVAEGALSLAQLGTVISQAGGVPLHIEELARQIARQPAAGARELPPSLSDLLAKRLEDLGPARRHAQVAAVLGEEFPTELFAAMLEADPVDARQALARLVDATVIVPREGSELYAFRHALIAVAAYGSLLRLDRRPLHARAAQLIVERFPDLAEHQPQVLARHWDEAGEDERAAATWESAGDLASQRRAFREAEHAYRQALAILARAELPDRDRREMRIRAAFNRVLQVTQGYSASEAAKSSERVRELAARVGADETLMREELLRWRSVFTAGDYAQAEAIAERVMALTAHQGDAQWRRAFRLRAGIQHGFYTGDLARGEAEFRAWREIQDGAYRHRAPGDDVLSIGIAGLIAEVDGRHAVGGQRIDAAFVSAAARGPYDLAMALHTAACFHHFARDAAGLADSAARLSELAQERGFEFADHLATGWLAIADANAGRAASALDRVRAAIAGFDRLKARVSLVFWHGVLGRARWLNGDAEGAAEAFAAALSLNDQERIFRPDVMLERAAALAAMGRAGDAERELRAVARLSSDIGAPLFQVRALVALGQAQLVKGDRAALRRTLRAAQAVAGERPGLCPHDRANLERLAQEAGFDDRPVARVRARLKA